MVTLIYEKIVTAPSKLCFKRQALLFIVFTTLATLRIASAETNELTEFQTLKLGMANPHVQAQWQAQLETARGHVQNAGRWENPSIDYSQENLDLPAGTSEESSFSLRQEINIAGVKGLERDAAESSFEAQKSLQIMNIRDWQRVLRENFYSTLAAQEKLALLSTVYSRLSNISDFASQRVERGDASRFEALRIEKELGVIASQLASAETEYFSMRHQLFSKIDFTNSSQKSFESKNYSLSGRLLPDVSSTHESLNKNNWLDHPEILAINSLIKAAELEAKAAGREYWPEVTIGVGRKEVNEPGFTADGNIVSLGLTIPLFDRGQGKHRIAQSTVKELQANKTLLLRQLDATWISTIHTLTTQQKSAQQLKTFSAHSERSLIRLSEASYQAGELSVMELIDAYQSDLEANEQYIDAALKARLAYIKLQYLTGE